MLTDERHDIIRNLLATDGRVLAHELAERFGVSEDTARRDLRELAKAGDCRRVHGGALPPAPAAASLAERRELNAPGKARLAAKAAGLVKSGQTLFIDAGSTNLAIARALPADIALTVVTNAPGIAEALASHAGVSIMLLGGRYDGRLGSTCGPRVLRDIDNVQADLFVLGGCAVEAGLGVSALDDEEAELKRAMAARSGAIVVAATSDKLGTAAPFRVVPPERLTHLVVEPDADLRLLDGLTQTMIHIAH